MSSKSSKNKSADKSNTKYDSRLKEALKHYDTFYEQQPPGMVAEKKDNPEDCIPDLPENREAREFLAKAPTKGLWMPLGKEVKVMKCWRCKAYGHRSGDKECPLFLSGNRESEHFRYTHEDPMYQYLMENRTKEKEERVKQLQAILEQSSSDSDSDSSSGREAKRRKHKHKKRHKKERKKRK